MLRRRAAAGLAALALTACQPASQPAVKTEVGFRLIEATPPRLVDTDPETAEALFVDDFEHSRGKWQILRGRGQIADGALLFESRGTSIELERLQEGETGPLHALEVRLTARRHLTVVLRRPDGNRWIDLEATGSRPDFTGARVFLFDLRGDARWQDLPQRLRLEIELPMAETVRLEEVRGLRFRPPRQPVALARRAEVDREVRNAFLMPPGCQLKRSLQAPARARLAFAFSASGRLSEAVSLRIAGRRPSGEWRQLFATEIEPLARAERRRWRPTSVALGDLAGGEIELRVESVASAAFDPVLGVPLWASPRLVFPGEARQPNLVLISVDTLRASHLEAYGYDRATAPSLDQWARESAVLFRQTVAQAPWTLPSHTSMLTGLDALSHGVNHSFQAAPESLETAAESLRRAGYFTAGLTGGGWLHPKFGLAQGFDQYRSWEAAGRRSEELATHVDRVGALLAELPEPFFLFFHTYAVHDYLPPGFQGDDEARIDHYDRAIGHMDLHIGRLLAELHARDPRRRTAIVLTSDHGEAHGEQGDYGHGSLRDPVLLVPLMFELPGGRAAGRRIDEQVRSIDIVPSLLELAGLPAARLDGASLLARLAGQAGEPDLAVSYFSTASAGLSLRSRNRFKYTFNNSAWADPITRESFFRLREDPGEVRDLAPGAAQMAGFRRLAREWLEARLPGLEIRLVNRGPRHFSGSLAGDLIGEWTVKSNDLSWQCLELTREGLARFAVPPATTCELLFERIGRPRLEVRTDADRQRQPLRVHLGQGLPAAYRWSDAGWQPGEDAGNLGIELHWRHMRNTGDTATYEQDPELERQLRALGYL